ncbi:MAG: amino acid ABC transporter permease [Candidatus Eiseniibacteriota bacterium]
MRAAVYQALLIVVVLAAAYYLISNTLANLERRNIRTGFGFLDQESGFFISETLIPSDAADTYGHAFVVGLLNTLKAALLGIVFATSIGLVIGLARLSANWLVARLASVYVESVRNVPLLLQLFFWYTIITTLLPAPQAALKPLPGVFLSKSGLQFPIPGHDPAYGVMLLAFVLGLLAAWIYDRWALRRQAATGTMPPRLWPGIGLIVGLPLVVWLLGGAPTALDVPHRETFRYVGGVAVTPEFLALLLGLSIYTAGFIAEIVRGGILAVPWGQTEAARALGLRQNWVMRLVILPQALRVIVPPLTGQYLNLVKNSTLAVAIGYPDLVSIATTSLNQTGQAIECVTVIMAVYLTISLAIAAFMNWYNKRVALVER